MFQECSDFMNNKNNEHNLRLIQIFTLKIFLVKVYGELFRQWLQIFISVFICR